MGEAIVNHCLLVFALGFLGMRIGGYPSQGFPFYISFFECTLIMSHYFIQTLLFQKSGQEKKDDIKEEDYGPKGKLNSFTLVYFC